MIEKIEIIDNGEFYVSGISVRTINQNGQSEKDMTALWNRFLNEHVFREFWNPVSDDIY